MVGLDIDMPESCLGCPIHDGESCVCNMNRDVRVDWDDRPRRCPLMEIKETKHCNQTQECDLVFHIYEERRIFLKTKHGNSIDLGLLKEQMEPLSETERVQLLANILCLCLWNMETLKAATKETKQKKESEAKNNEE